MKLDQQARSEIRAAVADMSLDKKLTYEDAGQDVAQVLKSVEELSNTTLKPIITRFNERQKAIKYEKWKKWQMTKLKIFLPILISIITLIVFLKPDA